MRKKPYLIDGIIGNSRMLASLTKDGQLQRLNWPHIDFPQQVNRFYTGIFDHNGEKATSFMHEEGWEYNQAYEGDTNILITSAVNHEEKVEIRQTDFVVPGMDVFVRDYTIKNLSPEARTLSFVLYSNFTLDDRTRFHTILFNMDEDCLVHYHREYSFAVGSSLEAAQYQCGYALEAAEWNRLTGKDINNLTDGAMSWELGQLGPGEERHLSIYIAAGFTIEESIDQLSQAKNLGMEELHERTKRYWEGYLKQAKPVDIRNEKIREVYIRSLLTFKLLNDEERGGFIAGPEVDEDYDYSGGYAYCWGRDAAYIATAADKAGYHDLVSKFYSSTMVTQSKNGAWMQRHYIEGLLGPTWGLQIDETGSILWGIHQHYLLTRNEEFIAEIWPAIEKGAEFLVSYIDPETKLPLPSKDLWEKREGEHLYSTAAVYGGLVGSADIARKFGRLDLAGKWEKAAMEMKQSVKERCWNEETGAFLRALKLEVPEDMYLEAKEAGKETLVETNKKGYRKYRIMVDPIVDICLLGLNYPFGMLNKRDDHMMRTAETIERELTSPKIGGIERFKGDVYIGGNPWILTTLWLGLYYIRIERYEKAREYLDWSVNYANHLGLLPEQVNKETGETAWVMPLTWSHAMFVLAVLALDEKGELNKK